jgi:acyl dehydratase
METFLSGNLDKVLVGANTGSFQGLRAQLFIFVGDKVDAEREVIDGRTLSAKVEDSNLGVGHTTVESRLRIRLECKIN